MNEACRGVSSIIITIGLNDQDEFSWGRSCVAGVESEYISIRQWGMWEPGGGKNVLDLKGATTLEDGHAKDDPCLAPHRTGSVICACFVAKNAIE